MNQTAAAPRLANNVKTNKEGQAVVSKLIASSNEKMVVLQKESLEIEETIMVAQKRVHFQRTEAQRAEMEAKEAMQLNERENLEREQLEYIQTWEQTERDRRKVLKESLLQATALLKEKTMEIGTLKQAEDKSLDLKVAIDQKRRLFQQAGKHVEESEKRERLELSESHERAARNLLAWQEIDARHGNEEEIELKARRNKLKAQQLKEFQQKEAEQLRELQHLKAKFRLTELDEELAFTERYEMDKAERLFEMDKLDQMQKLEKQKLKKRIRELKENARKANMLETAQTTARLLRVQQEKRAKQMVALQKKHNEEMIRTFEHELSMRAQDFKETLSSENFTMSGTGGSNSTSKNSSKAGALSQGSGASGISSEGAASSDAAEREAPTAGDLDDDHVISSSTNTELKAQLQKQKSEALEAIKLAEENIKQLVEKLNSERDKLVDEHKSLDERGFIEWEELRAQRRHKNEAEIISLVKLHNKEKSEMKGAHLRELENLDLSLKIEKQLHEQSISESQVASQAKSEFLSFVCHELRNPLSGIMAIVDMLIDGGKIKGDMSESVHTIKQESELMCAIVNDVLDYAKIEANMLVLDPVRFNLKKALMDLIESQKEVAKKSCPDVTMSYEIADNVPSVIEGDPLRLRQILLNLISNSIKFTFQGTIKIKISMGEGNDLNFSVVDTGIGIAQKDVEYLFSAFSQSKPSITREFGGTGLGLSISKALIECMGGNIGVESTVGVGTNFWFNIKVGNTGAPMKRDDTPAGTTSISNLSFLIAEDSSTLRKLWSRLLQEQGCTVESVGNGREALDMCKTKAYDVVLMDITMPVLSGDQAVKQLRKDGWEGVVIALTGNDTEIDQDKFIDSGMDAVLTKPFQMERLRLLVVEELKKKGRKV